MPTTYEQEIYTFLAEKKNYQAAKEVSAKLPDFEQWLRGQFKEDLASLLAQELPDYQVKKQENAIYVRKTEWPESLVVGFDWSDGSDFGVIAPESAFHRKNAWEVLESYGLRVKNSNEEWVWWENLPEYSLQDPAFLVRILPENRSESVKGAVSHLKSFLDRKDTHGESEVKIMDAIVVVAK